MPRNAVILVVDRLGAGFLGPYGNTWLETPALNQLAREAFLVENCLSSSPELADVYQSLWRAESQAALSGGTFLTDDPELAEHPLAAVFAEQIVLPPGVAGEAATVEETALGSLLAAAAEWLNQAQAPFLLWIHARGMQGPWDAPWELRAALADEDDPPPPRFVAPPEEFLSADGDPDHKLGLVQAYGAQIQAFDTCLGSFLEAFQASPAANETLFALTSPRGYPLAEHGRVGRCDQPLYAELLQVPLLLRLPEGVGAIARTQQILQLGDLAAALSAWRLEQASSDLLTLARGETIPTREVALALAPGQRALRTPAWFLRENLRGAEPVRELFVKPDDRFEVNEVASRCGEIVEKMLLQLEVAQAQATGGGRLTLLPEMGALRDEWR